MIKLEQVSTTYCPFCSAEETKVTDKRETEDGITRRRRECLKCEKRFTTYERCEIGLRVMKKDGTREQYDREKLKRGILKACEKRPVPTEKIEEAMNRIEAILNSKNSAEVESKIIGELAMRELKKLDKVAYIRFASVYKEFEDPRHFQEEVKVLLKR